MVAHILGLVVALATVQGAAPVGTGHSGARHIVSPGNGGGVSSQGTDLTVWVPELVCVTGGLTDPFDHAAKTAFRPQTIDLDGITIRQVLTALGVTVDENLIVQSVAASKVTPYWKCNAFVVGPGSGQNTNFDSGWKYANSTKLDKSILRIAFGIPDNLPALGTRSLLFSPPTTKYTLKVVYVVRNPITGRTGPPTTVTYNVEVLPSDRPTMRHMVEYFSTVAAGVTQRPKIDSRGAQLLYDALAVPDDLDALLAIESVIATYSIDFTVLRDTTNANGKYDCRFVARYLVDDDEEPIGCLLEEMASNALWN